MDQTARTNYLLKIVSKCAPLKKNSSGKPVIVFTDAEIAYLSFVYQAEDTPKQVRDRAQFKLALIWREKDKRYETAKKAQKTRKANANKSDPVAIAIVAGRAKTAVEARPLVSDNRFWPFVGGIK